MMLIKYDATIFAWFLSSFGPLSLVLAAYHLVRGGMPLHDLVGVTIKKTKLRKSMPRYTVYSNSNCSNSNININ